MRMLPWYPDMMTDYIWMIIWFNTKPSQCKASDYRNCGWNCVTLYGFRARSTLVLIWSLGFQVQYLSFPVQYQERDCGSWPSPRESSPHNSLLCNQQTPANTKPNTKAFIQIQNYQNTNRQTGTLFQWNSLSPYSAQGMFWFLQIQVVDDHSIQNPLYSTT